MRINVTFLLIWLSWIITLVLIIWGIIACFA